MAEAGNTEDKRTLTSIEVTPESMEAIQRFTSRYGQRGPKKTVLSRLIEWFAIQPDTVKTAILGWIDEGMEQPYAEFLRKLADEMERKPLHHIQGITTGSQLADHAAQLASASKRARDAMNRKRKGGRE